MLYFEYENFPGWIFEKTIRENYTVYYEKQLFTTNRRWSVVSIWCRDGSIPYSIIFLSKGGVIEMIYISMMVLGIVIGMCVGLTVRKHKTGHGYFKVVVMEDQPDLATVNVRIPTDQDLELLHEIILTRE